MKSIRLWCVVGAWLLTVGFGMACLLVYENEPGSEGQVPERWPADTRLPRRPGVASLLMFVHPECPCTRASLTELARLQARIVEPVDIQLIFASHPELERVQSSALWQTALGFSGVRLVADDRAAECRRFDARTSGEVMLFDGAGQLRYWGGITGSRGHEGDNYGAAAVVAVFSGRQPERTRGVSFGCPLFASSDPGDPPCCGKPARPALP